MHRVVDTNSNKMKLLGPTWVGPARSEVEALHFELDFSLLQFATSNPLGLSEKSKPQVRRSGVICALC
jgi:hypothetical protein